MSSYLKAKWLKSSILLLAGLPFISISAQEPVELELSGQLSMSTNKGRIYEVMLSSDAQSWSRSGHWIMGDGDVHTVIVPFSGDATYARVEDSPVADLTTGLEAIRSSTQVPALAAVVIQDGRITGAGATGFRRFGTDVPVTLKDKFHHGSITKSMTATLAAMLVEEGLIDWTTTLGEVFSESVSAMASGWSGVTLKHLLSNSSGAPGDLNAGGIWTKLWNFQGTPEPARQLLFDEVTTRPLRFTPGAGYEYSNAGFALGGMMLETVTGTSWETLMHERFFPAFGMASGGTGAPATPRHLDHPVGHSGTVTNPVIYDPGVAADNPPAIGPAATAHATIVDLARYVQAHLLGARGATDRVLSPLTWEFLHTRAYGNDYALGWEVTNRPWGGGDVLVHTGSNTQWYTTIWIAPEVNWACVVSSNFGGTDAYWKNDEAIIWLLNNFGP